MALWRIYPVKADQSVIEIQTWKKFDYQLIREEKFNWAEFTVNSDSEPVVDLVNNSGYLVNHDVKYSWSLSQLMQTVPEPKVNWIYPDTMSSQEIVVLKNLIDSGGYLALDTDGWVLENTDFWIYGELTINQLPEEEWETNNDFE